MVSVEPTGRGAADVPPNGRLRLGSTAPRPAGDDAPLPRPQIPSRLRESISWPKSIVVRLHLKGLESFKTTVGDTAVEWSVSSTGSHTKRVSLHKGGDESTLDETSPYYSEVRIAGGNVKIPLQSGYFEVALPAKLFEGNPDEITLRWIDFYRN